MADPRVDTKASQLGCQAAVSKAFQRVDWRVTRWAEQKEQQKVAHWAVQRAETRAAQKVQQRADRMVALKDDPRVENSDNQRVEHWGVR